MFCSNCGHGREAEAPSNFCANCGADLHSDESSGSDLEHSEAVFDEESLIKYYYHRGFAYKEILKFLEKHHNHCISYCTLLRRLQHYGLRRKQQVTDNTINLVRERISTIIDGPGSSEGYRSLWHRLELEGLRVPRAVVAAILKELDPQGRTAKISPPKKEVYRNPGPNYAWHIDGYDKLKHHGTVDRLVPVSEEKIQYASTHVIEEVQTHELQDYFEYVRLSLGCRVPDSWQTALDLYNSLLEIAEHGTE
ncbi:uncharacterized protein LOC114543332 [Dendronephthya gigantea]|uniref:uncharacterized protein LOC114543332 n=1 Tax=Dendronephthya gigantea TaxID=151771 RepID=UPI00106B0B78|nr:uncharacterized protein LOC114543332 [Dendronephthya gigantea]